MTAGRPPAHVGAVGALMRGGSLPLLAAGSVVVAVAACQGRRAGVGAAVGIVLAGAAMAAGPATLHLVRSSSPTTVMAAALGTYAACLFLLGVAGVFLAGAPWLSAQHLGIGLIIGVCAWTVGQVRATARVRVPYVEPDKKS